MVNRRVPIRVESTTSGDRRHLEVTVVTFGVRERVRVGCERRRGDAYAPAMSSPPPSKPGPFGAASVAIVMAMEIEAAPLVEELAAEPVAVPAWAAALPVRLYGAPATPRRPEVLVAVNGVDPISGVAAIGTTAAALTTQVALNLEGRSRPDLALSVGTAGGWARHGAAIGDAYLVWPNFACHDRRIDLPGFPAYARGELPAADLRDHAEALDCALAVVTTGDSLDESSTDRAGIAANGGRVKEMEAAAVAWVSNLNDVPVNGLKVITDIVDSEVATPEQFTANLALASETLRHTTLALLERLAHG